MSFNKRLLTVEDANSVIEHFGKGFCDYYTLDTRLLTIPDTWFAYDFIDVYRVEDNITFSIKNSLWTKGYKILDCNIGSPSVTVEDDSIGVSGTGLEWVVLVLELSPEFQYDDYLELDFNPIYTPVIRPFYEDVALTMGFFDGDSPVTGLSVDDLVTGDTLVTDSDGLVSVISPVGKHGDYDYGLETVNGGETVDYNFPFIRIKSELPVRLVNDTVYRDKRNTLTFEFLFDDEYNITEAMLFTGNEMVLTVDNVEYNVESFTGNQFSFTVPIGSRNELNMRLLVEGNDYLNQYNVDFNVPVEVFMVDTASDLKAELESELSASVVLFTGTELDTEITVDKNVLVRFSDLVESELDTVFTVSDNAVLSLADCNFTGKTLVQLDNGECIIESGTFTHCTRPVLTGNGDATVMDCQFIDNTTGISLTGDLELMNTLFDLSDGSYYNSGSPSFLECYGDLTLDYCQFSVIVADVVSLGLGYVLFLLGKGSVVNGVSASNLLSNEVFPFRKCTSELDISSEHYHITGKNNKAVTWSVEDTNTVYSNQLSVEYLEEE